MGDVSSSVILFCPFAFILGPALRSEPCSRKLDKRGTVLPVLDSGEPSYRHSWIIGAVFDEIEWSTVPITPHRGRETGPIRSVCGTVFTKLDRTYLPCGKLSCSLTQSLQAQQSA